MSRDAAVRNSRQSFHFPLSVMASRAGSVASNAAMSFFSVESSSSFISADSTILYVEQGIGKLEFPQFLQVYDQCTYGKNLYSTSNHSTDHHT